MVIFVTNLNFTVMKERIEKIMEYKQMTAAVFADRIGIQRSTLAHILNGRNNPSLDVVMKIHQCFEDINLEWLLDGIGSMVNNSSPYKRKDNYDLFSNSVEQNEQIKRKQTSVVQQTEPVKTQEVVRYIEKPRRNITEIRIIYEDNSFEIYKPEK